MNFLIRYVFFAMCSIFYFSCSSDTSEEEASLVYEIELEKFNIPSSANYKDRDVAIATTCGINNALNYAKENGYVTVKFPARQYAIISQWQELHQTVLPKPDPKCDLRGIVVPSGMTLDLGDAVFRLLPNNQISYSLFLINKVENVTINGGHLIGDRYEHIYDAPNADPEKKKGSHEWGFGFNIVASKNITINRSKVEQMTGDAVITNHYQWPKSTIANDNVKVSHCELFDCRRQGISLVHGNNTELSFNHIYKINGTAPMCGIDIEEETDSGCEVKYTKIHNNLIHDVGKEAASIMCSAGDYIDIYENEVQWITVWHSSYVNIYKNIVSPGDKSIVIHNENPVEVKVYDNVFVN